MDDSIEHATGRRQGKQVRRETPRAAKAVTRQPGVPRTIVRKIRYRPDEWAVVVRHAGVCQIPPAEYVRDVSLGYVPRVRRRHPDLELVRQLLRIGNNLNQLTVIAHRARQVAVATQCAAVLAEVTAAAERVGRRIAADDDVGDRRPGAAVALPTADGGPLSEESHDRRVE